MRVGVTLVAGWIAAFVLVVAAPAGAEDASSLKAEFLRDYPRALKALEARFERVRGVAKYKDERHLVNTRGMDIGATAIDSSALEFECKLPSMVRVVETGEEAVTKGDATKSRSHCRVRGYNDDYSFELKLAAGGKFSVTSLLNSTDQEFKDEKRRWAESLLRYLGAPFYLDVFPMSKFLRGKNVSIRSVSRVRAGTRQMLKAEFEMSPPPLQKGAMRRVGWFTVSPGEAWALHEYEFDHGDISRHGSVEYGEMQAGVPVLRRFTRTATRLGKLLNAQTYDFEKLEFVDVPERDFTLSAFGLPEPERPAGRNAAVP